MRITSMTTHEIAMQLAARAGCDVRTARRALSEGPRAIRTILLRERLEREIARMGEVLSDAHADGERIRD